MIASNELRIGNYILDQKERIRRVWTIKQSSVMVSDYDIDERDIFPIPLTPLILEKCGFVLEEFKGDSYGKEVGDVYRNGIAIINKEGVFHLWVYIEGDEFYSFEWTVVHHLHQLQNLCFALTGEELDVSKIFSTVVLLFYNIGTLVD
jgi:hypothetical protein